VTLATERAKGKWGANRSWNYFRDSVAQLPVICDAFPKRYSKLLPQKVLAAVEVSSPMSECCYPQLSGYEILGAIAIAQREYI